MIGKFTGACTLHLLCPHYTCYVLLLRLRRLGPCRGTQSLTEGATPSGTAAIGTHTLLCRGEAHYTVIGGGFLPIYIYIFNTMAMRMLGTFTDLHSLYLSLLGYPYICPYTSLFTYTLLWNLRLVYSTSVIGNWHPGRGVQQSELVRQALCV